MEEEYLTDYSDNSASDDESTLAEYDVYLNTEGCQSIEILQFPLLPKSVVNAPFVQEAFRKPKHRDLKLTYKANTNNPFYEINDDSSRLIPHTLTLKGTNIVHNRDEGPCYAVGLFKEAEKELHLTPVSNITTMAPDLSHLDKEIKLNKEQEETPKTTVPVEVFQLRKETKEAHEYRKRQFKYIEEQRSKEKYEALQIMYSHENNPTLLTF